MLIFLLCFGAPAWAYETTRSGPSSHELPAGSDFYLDSFDRLTNVLRDSDRLVRQTLALSLAPKVLELRANYWEARTPATFYNGADAPGSVLQGSYFNMLAKSSPWDGKLVGESEFAYSAPGASAVAPETPLMARFGVGGNWNKAGYGFTHRSLARGFIPLGGVQIEHDRDESQLWGEYNFDFFRLRAAAGEICETDSVSRQLILTRSATASLQVRKLFWDLLLSSNYSTVDRSDPAAAKSFAFAHRLALAYRRAPLLTFEPAVQLSSEWQPSTGTKTDTPSAGFTFAFAPLKEFQLVGGASFSKRLHEDLREDVSSIHSTAGINWKLGKSPIGNGSVSFQLEYKNESGAALSSQEQAQLTGMIQFKLAGF
jgi:hypothetical protein